MRNTFRKRIRQSIADENLQIALDNNARRRKEGRLAAFAAVPDHQERRQRAHAVKADVIANLERYLDQFTERVAANDIRVHRAADADEAIDIFLQIAESNLVRHPEPGISGDEGRRTPILVAKSKSMVSEEIRFNHALEARSMRVVETDLGEYIVQLRGERPSHILTPAVHLRRQQVGQLFHEKLGIPYTEDIPTLTATARKVLREVFLTADIGVSGVNFGVAETGTLCLVTNEGNGRMCTTVPPVHVALMGIERMVPTLDDLALFLSLLPRSGTGQKLSVYTSLIHGPRRPGDGDGPRERHLILVDNGRRRLGGSELAEALFCIRCGACLNACPVFRETGGHAYRGKDDSIAPYPGPIGSVISPGLFGCDNFGHLAQVSSLCGACKEACPVDIDLPGMLLRIRAGQLGPDTGVRPGVGVPAPIKLGLKAFRFAAGIPGLFALGQRLGGLVSRLYSPRRVYMRLPAWTGWGISKDFPRLAGEPFRARWKGIKQDVKEAGPATRRADEHEAPRPPAARSLAAQFSDEFAALGGKLHLAKEHDLPGLLADFLQSSNFECVLVDGVGAEYAPEHLLVRNPDPSVRCGVTGALAGIAESGSLVLVGGGGHSLTASLLPEVHVAILKTSRIVASVADALCMPEVRGAAAGVIITGPSRTADIEMTLTIGVHGPGEIHVFLIDDSTGV